MTFAFDQLLFTPVDVDLARSPLRHSIGVETFVLGAFNPGLTRLPNGNLLMMVRVAEALRQPLVEDRIHAIRWTAAGYERPSWPRDTVDMGDPRQFALKRPGVKLLGLTSISWLLPVELTSDGREVIAAHYDRAIEPSAPYQEYGVEDPRISLIDGRYWMTVCSVSGHRLGTSLYASENGLDWRLEGLILDHLNKDMLMFEGKVGGKFFALTRPLGEVYFAEPLDGVYHGGPSINLAESPDGLHWKPCEEGGIRGRRGVASASKVGGGAPPILTERGWLVLYHGVEQREQVGVYRTFWAVLDRDDPTKTLFNDDEQAVLESNPALVAPIAHLKYLPTEVVFTTGMVDAGDHYIVASGEADLACRITHMPKALFA